jgi:ABC-2 type transport system permease protein
MHVLKVISVYLRLSALNEMQYRANFFIQVLNTILEIITGLGGLALVFYHTNTLGGWGPNELLAVMGVYMLIGGILNVVISPSMNRLAQNIRQGTLDYTIVRPVDTQVLVSVTDVQIWSTVDILMGLTVLIVAVVRLGLSVGAVQALAFAVALLSGAAIIYSLWLIVATTAFWITQVWAILRMFQSLYQTGRWPVSIYPNWLRYALTFIVPVAFAITVPAQAVTGRLNTGTLLLSMGIGVAALVLSRLFWRFGLRNYSGASA